MLVPVTVPRASTMLRRHDARRRDAVARRIIELAVATGVLKLLPASRLHLGPTDGIVEHLQRLLDRPIQVGVLLGSDRVNRKPVLRVFSPGGETVAFLKAAEGAVSALVQREAQSLLSIASAVASTDLLEVPQVLHSGSWGGLELLMLSPMEASQARGTDDDPHLGAALELARLVGLRERSVLEVIGGLRARLAAMGPSADLARAGAHLDHLAEQVPTKALLTGCWHGDWSPWNMGRHRGRVQVWDWERFDEGVPVGYEAVHHRAQLLWRDSVPATDCRPALISAADDMLRLAEVVDRDAESVVRLYLVEILLRYLEHSSADATLRPRTRWVLDQLDSPLLAAKA